MENTVKGTRLKTDLCAHLLSVRSVANDEQKHALDVAVRVIDEIDKYTSKHDLALSCGGEWMYQSDRGQIDALELVSKILCCLSEYAEDDEDDEEWSEDDDE